MRRLVAASESLAIGFGGTSQVSRQTGVSRRAIIRGIKELDEAQVCKGAEYAARVEAAENRRQRRLFEDGSGTFGGSLTRAIPSLRCVGRARACANWRKNSTGLAIRPVIGWWPSCCMNWAIACRQPQDPGRVQPCRPRPAIPAHQPACHRVSPAAAAVISVDTKKKELVGNFKNHGAELRPKGDRNQCACMTL